MKMKLTIVLVFAVPLFTIAKCFHADDVIVKPVSIAENTNKAFNPLLQRIKRHALGLGEGRLHLPARVQSRAPTVIVVPERGTGALPAYSAGPISPYSVNTPNRGTTVVVSQVPEYNNYHTVGRSYDIMPINPMRI